MQVPWESCHPFFDSSTWTCPDGSLKSSLERVLNEQATAHKCLACCISCQKQYEAAITSQAVDLLGRVQATARPPSLALRLTPVAGSCPECQTVSTETPTAGGRKPDSESSGQRDKAHAATFPPRVALTIHYQAYCLLVTEESSCFPWQFHQRVYDVALRASCGDTAGSLERASTLTPCYGADPDEDSNACSPLRTEEEARAWAAQHADILHPQELERLQALDFGPQRGPKVVLSHAILAVAEWILGADEANSGGQATAPGPPQPSPAGSSEDPRSQLREWALAMRHDPEVLAYTGRVRPSLLGLSAGAGSGCTSGDAPNALLELLHAPPLRQGLLRTGDDAVTLLRLAALLKRRNGKTEGSWQLRPEQLAARLEDLIEAAEAQKELTAGVQPELPRPLQPQRRAAASAPHPARTPPRQRRAAAVEALLRGINSNAMEVIGALALPSVGANTSICSDCRCVLDPEKRKSCHTCVDTFCGTCFGAAGPNGPFDRWWSQHWRERQSCRYCCAALADTLQLDAVAAAADALARILEHPCWAAGAPLSELPAELLASLTAASQRLVTQADAHRLRGDLSAQPRSFWAAALTAHTLAARALVRLQREAWQQQQQKPDAGLSPPPPPPRNAEEAAAVTADTACSAATRVFHASKTLLDTCMFGNGPSALPTLRRLARGVLRTHTLHAYAAVLAGWADGGVPLRALPSAVDCLAVFMGTGNLCALAVGGSARVRLDEELYLQWLSCLHSSGLVEHAARALLALQEAARRAAEVEGGALGGAELSKCHAALDSARHALQQSVIALQGTLSEHTGLHAHCPRPLYRTVNTSFGSAAVAPVRAARAVLSGPCLQFLVGRDLLAATLRMCGGEGPRYGMTAEQLGPVETRPSAAAARGEAPAPPSQTATESLGEGLTVWQLTVSGPCPPRIAQPPVGWLPEGVPWADPLGLTSPLPPPKQRLPYNAVNVYDLTAGALEALLRHRSRPQQGESVSNVLVLAVELCIRLAMELRPRHAAARLPGLWRIVSAVVAASAVQLDFLIVAHSAGRLLRLELPLPPREQGRRREQSPQQRHVPTVLQLEQVVGAECRPAGPQQQAAMQGRTGELQQGPRPAPGAQSVLAADGEDSGKRAEVAHAVGKDAAAQPCNQRDGAHGTFKADQELAGPVPAFSIQCAIDGGWVAAVESMVRALARARGDAGPSLTVMDDVLRWSGVWPAFLAHGSVREVASLIVTLRKAAQAWSGRKVGDVMLAGNMNVRMTATNPVGRSFFLAFLLSLLEQTAAMVIPEASAPSESSVHSGGQMAQPPVAGGCGGNVGVGPGEAYGPLALSDALGQGASAPMQLEWLVRAGGRPDPNSPAAEQQRMLAVFALTQWLPAAMTAQPPEVTFAIQWDLVIGRWLLVAAMQAFAAALAPAAEQAALTYAAAAAAAPGACSADGGDGLGRTAEAPEQAVSEDPTISRSEAWWGFFHDDYTAFHWLHRRLVWAASGKAPGGYDVVMLPLLLDILEVLASVRPTAVFADFPPRMLLTVVPHAAGGNGGKDSSGDGVCTTSVAAGAGCADGVAAAQQSSGSKGLERRGGVTLADLLRQHGRNHLLAVLEDDADAHIDTGCGDAVAGGSSGGGSGGGGSGGGSGGGGSGGGSGDGRSGDMVDRSGSGNGDGSGGAADRSGGGLVRHTSRTVGQDAFPMQSIAVDALHHALLAKYDFSRLPALPTPYSALAAAAAVRLVSCNNSRCANMEGPSEVALTRRKVCSRCRAVMYCCGACQLAHWREEHQDWCHCMQERPEGYAPCGAERADDERLARWLDVLPHALSCPDDGVCQSARCGYVGYLVRHWSACAPRMLRDCESCALVWRLLASHAKRCTRADCAVFLCKEMGAKAEGHKASGQA